MVNLLDPWGAKVPVLQPRGEFTIAAGAVTLVGEVMSNFEIRISQVVFQTRGKIKPLF